MKESTRKALERASNLAAANGHDVKLEDFKFHSEKTWIAVTENKHVITATITITGDVVVVLYKFASGLLLTDVKPEETPKPKAKKKNAG